MLRFTFNNDKDLASGFRLIFEKNKDAAIILDLSKRWQISQHPHVKEWVIIEPIPIAVQFSLLTLKII